MWHSTRENESSSSSPFFPADSRRWETKKERWRRGNGREGENRGKFRELFLVSVRVINAFSRSDGAIGSDALRRLFARFIGFQNASRPVEWKTVPRPELIRSSVLVFPYFRDPYSIFTILLAAEFSERRCCSRTAKGVNVRANSERCLFESGGGIESLASIFVFETLFISDGIFEHFIYNFEIISPKLERCVKINFGVCMCICNQR